MFKTNFKQKDIKNSKKEDMPLTATTKSLQSFATDLIETRETTPTQETISFPLQPFIILTNKYNIKFIFFLFNLNGVCS